MFPSEPAPQTQPWHGLADYCFFTLMHALRSEKFESDDKNKIEEAVHDTLDWLDENQLVANRDEFEAKQKELEAIVNPIMMKVSGEA